MSSSQENSPGERTRISKTAKKHFKEYASNVSGMETVMNEVRKLRLCNQWRRFQELRLLVISPVDYEVGRLLYQPHDPVANLLHDLWITCDLPTQFFKAASD